MNYDKIPIVILSKLCANVFENVLKNLDLKLYSEVWLIEENTDVSKVASRYNLKVQYINDHKRLNYITPSKENLHLSECFLFYTNFMFVYQNSITKDNYLLGALYHLTKLLETQPQFLGIKLFELYLFFQSSNFIAVTEKNLISNKTNAWMLDSNLIRCHKLKINKLYHPFFQHLSLHVGPQDNIYHKIPKKNEISLYPLKVKFILLGERYGRQLSKISTIISTSAEMIHFRWKRYKRMRSN